MIAEQALQRDPRFETWEAERVWLIAREYELHTELEGVDADEEKDAYLAAETDGFDEEYCSEQAEKVASKRREIKKAIRGIRARVTLIGPLLKQERVESSKRQPTGNKHLRWEKSQERDGHHVALMERIATALEKIASALPCKATHLSKATK